MAQLWKKDHTETNASIAAFTVGQDPVLDQHLARWDVLASAAHAQMLAQQGIISTQEANDLCRVLGGIYRDCLVGPLPFGPDDEDVHTYLERILTEELGDTGKKIHAGRSRNDQVLTATKLYARHKLCALAADVQTLAETLIELAEAHKNCIIPGFTHTQVAMPSSVELWCLGYAEALAEELGPLHAAFQLCNRNPLGSAAGFGSSMPLDRSLTTELLEFEGLVINPINAQMGRGRTELAVTNALAQMAYVIGRLADDVCLMNAQFLGLVTLPEAFTTGSSIMPQKRNPDVFELIRGHANLLKGVPQRIQLLLANQISGYHRDVQLLKGELMGSLNQMAELLELLTFAIPHLKFQDRLGTDDRFREMYAVERVNALVMQGSSFRDAYKTIGAELETVSAADLGTHTLEGGLHNPMAAEIAQYLNHQAGLFPTAQLELWEQNFVADYLS